MWRALRGLLLHGRRDLVDDEGTTRRVVLAAGRKWGVVHGAVDRGAAFWAAHRSLKTVKLRRRPRTACSCRVRTCGSRSDASGCGPLQERLGLDATEGALIFGKVEGEARRRLLGTGSHGHVQRDRHSVQILLKEGDSACPLLVISIGRGGGGVDTPKKHEKDWLHLAVCPRASSIL
jgi:hypothetical protein